MGKPFQEKNPTLQNLHNVLSNQDDYNTLAMQVLIGAHHNSTSERLLLAPALQIELKLYRHLPKPYFYSDFTTWKPLEVLQNHGQTSMPHVTHFKFTFPIRKNNQDKVIMSSTILSLSLDLHKSHKMSRQ